MQAKNVFTLFDNVKSVIIQTQQTIVRNVNQAMVLAYFQMGKMIVEDEQNGKDRADYADETLNRLSKSLILEFGKGYSASNLKYMRGFYQAYQFRICQTPSGELNGLFNLSWSHYVV